MSEFKVLNKILEIPDEQAEVLDELFCDFQRYEANNDNYGLIFSHAYATDEIRKKFNILSELIWNLTQANSISDQRFFDSLLANINYSQVNLRYKDTVTIEDLIKEILYHEVMFRHPSKSDYIRASFKNSLVARNFPQLTQSDFIDKDGLVYARNLTLRECGIELGKDTLYYSPFIKSDLLRYQVVGLLTKKLMAVSENPSIQLRVAIDPFRYLLNQKPPLTIKKAMAFGPSLDFTKIYASKDGRFEYFDEYAEYGVAKRVQGSISTLENGCKQITIEELDTPSENDFEVGRFAHIIFSRDGQSISHFDCAIKVYNELEYLKRREEYFKSEKYIKVFRLDGTIDFKIVHEICFEFFQDNQLIGEMFK